MWDIEQCVRFINRNRRIIKEKYYVALFFNGKPAYWLQVLLITTSSSRAWESEVKANDVSIKYELLHIKALRMNANHKKQFAQNCGIERLNN